MADLSMKAILVQASELVEDVIKQIATTPGFSGSTDDQDLYLLSLMYFYEKAKQFYGDVPTVVIPRFREICQGILESYIREAPSVVKDKTWDKSANFELIFYVLANVSLVDLWQTDEKDLQIMDFLFVQRGNRQELKGFPKRKPNYKVDDVMRSVRRADLKKRYLAYAPEKVVVRENLDDLPDDLKTEVEPLSSSSGVASVTIPHPSDTPPVPDSEVEAEPSESSDTDSDNDDSIIESPLQFFLTVVDTCGRSMSDVWERAGIRWKADAGKCAVATHDDYLTEEGRHNITDLFLIRLYEEVSKLPSDKEELKKLELENFTAYACICGIVSVQLAVIIDSFLLEYIVEAHKEFADGWRIIYDTLYSITADAYYCIREYNPAVRCNKWRPINRLLCSAFYLACVFADASQDVIGDCEASYRAVGGIHSVSFSRNLDKFECDEYYEMLWRGYHYILKHTVGLMEPLSMSVEKYIATKPEQGAKEPLYKPEEGMGEPLYKPDPPITSTSGYTPIKVYVTPEQQRAIDSIIGGTVSQRPSVSSKKSVSIIAQEDIKFEPAPDKIPNVRVVQETAKWIESQQPFKDYLAKYPNFAQILNVKGICKEIARCNEGKIPAYEDIKKLFGSHVFTLYMCVPVLYYVAKYDGLFKANFRGNEDLTSKYQTFYGTMATDIIKVMQYSKLRECNSKRPDFLRRTESRLMAFPDQCVELENLIFRMRDAEDTQITFESVGDYISSLSELYS